MQYEYDEIIKYCQVNYARAVEQAETAMQHQYLHALHGLVSRSFVLHVFLRLK